MLKPLLHFASPAGGRARLSILIFHRVLATPDPLFPAEVDAVRFDRICRWIRQWYRVAPLLDAASRLRDGTLPARTLCITFDDGYADNHGVALPILKSHGLTATFFVASGCIDGGCMWNDKVIAAVRHCRRERLDLGHLNLAGCDSMQIGTIEERRSAVGKLLAALKYLEPQRRSAAADAISAAAGAECPADLMMTSAQVAELARQGMQVGGHTVSHPILKRLSEDEAYAEIANGRLRLQSITQTPVDSFAYPNGRPGVDYSSRDVELVKRAGFKAAVSTAWGAADARCDNYQLPRFTPWDNARWRFGLRMARNLAVSVDTCHAGSHRAEA